MPRSILPCALLLLALILLISPSAHAAETAEPVPLTITATGHRDVDILTDGDDMFYLPSYRNCQLTLESTRAFSSLYFMYDQEFGEYTITNNATGETVTAGQYGFIHEFVQLPWETTSVTVTYPNVTISISEITAYTAGIPEDVQVWLPPLDGETELLLMSTHGDDEQLFFAGLLPLYAGQRDYKVQVAYMTDHRNLTMERTHEMLNGLWSVGVRNYPVFGGFHDFRIDSLLGTYQEYAERNVSRRTLLKYVVMLLRRFKPQVVVTHDFNGEYGHGMHKAYADLLSEAITISNDPQMYKDVAEEYGLWEVQKAYFHLYEQNPIVMDYDIPLRSFDGMTAFNVTQKLGFPCHLSQVRDTDFGLWLCGETGEITKATEIDTYSPCQFGLYFTTIGEDSAKNDFMENTPGYYLRQRDAEALSAREAAATEDDAQLESRSAALEEKARQDEETTKRLEEKRRKEEQEAQRRERQQLTLFMVVLGVVIAMFALVPLLKKLLTPRKPLIDPNEPLDDGTEPAPEAPNVETVETVEVPAEEDNKPSE